MLLHSHVMNIRDSLRRLPTACLVAGLLVGLGLACDLEDDEAPIEQRLCERFDACNYFAAGVDVSDCTDVLTMCSDDLLRSERSDWAREAEAALGKDNCSNFLDDYQEVSACTIRDDGSVPSSSGSGSGSNPEPGDDDDDGPAPGEGGETCGDDYFTCTGESSIEACIDGEFISASCDEVCAAGDEPLEAVECAYDEDREHDVCICTDVTEEPEPAPEEPEPAPEEPDEPAPPGPAPEPGE